MEKMTKKKVLVFLDVSVDGDPFERMIFEVLCFPIILSICFLKLLNL